MPKQYDASFQNQIVFAELMERGLFAYFDHTSHTVIIKRLTIEGIDASLVWRKIALVTARVYSDGFL